MAGTVADSTINIVVVIIIIIIITDSINFDPTEKVQGYHSRDFSWRKCRHNVEQMHNY